MICDELTQKKCFVTFGHRRRAVTDFLCFEILLEAGSGKYATT